MTIYRFERVKSSAFKSGKCAVCGKTAKRTRVFENTVNPYNRNEDGTPRTYAEVRKRVDKMAREWEFLPLLHAGCEDA